MRGNARSAGLRLVGDALGALLVEEHVRMPAADIEVDRKRVAGEHALQPRILRQARIGWRGFGSAKLRAVTSAVRR